jgi:CHAT domain-containing protein
MSAMSDRSGCDKQPMFSGFLQTAGVVAVTLFLALFGAGTAGAENASERAAALDYIGRGKAAFRVGDLVAATAEWSQAIRLCHQLGDNALEAEALTRRGEAYSAAGHFREATEDLQAALNGAEESGDLGLVAAASGALGNLSFLSRRTATAEPLLNRSRDLAQRLNDPRILAASANDLGNLYAATDRPAEAASAYDQAVAAALRAGDEALSAIAQTNAARLAFRRGDGAQAAALLTHAVDRLAQPPPSGERGIGLVTAGSIVFEREGAIDPALRAPTARALQTAAVWARTLDDNLLASLAIGSLGRLAEREGRVAEAARFTDQALFAAQQANAVELSSRWEWQRARLLRRQGDVAGALASYRRAVAALEGVRQEIPVEYRGGHSSYRATYGALYLEFADLLLRQAAAAPGTAAPLLKEARDDVELLKEGELQDYFRDSCVTSFEAKRRSIDTLAPGTAVIYPIVLPDRLEILVSFGTDERQFTVPITAVVLGEEVLSFRRLLEERTTNQYLAPAKDLYDRIVRPLDPLLTTRHIDTLVIVPDGVLRLIPFAALYDGQHFLVERYATAIAPSLRLVDPRPFTSQLRDVLAVGLSDPVEGYPGLPHVAEEVAEVRDLENGKELLNQSFRRAVFARELETVPYNLVHIASHGEFGSDPSRTYVLAFDGPLTMDDLERDVKFGEYRENALELLTLSACKTAASDDRSALGLAGLALKSGARSALATLWFVDDLASGELVTSFYRSLREAPLSKARALQLAQQQFLADPVFGHPAYWAPFLLIGNWL